MLFSSASSLGFLLRRSLSLDSACRKATMPARCRASAHACSLTPLCPGILLWQAASC